MMVHCPKCGFEQPRDHYCASCGIDMRLFQPRKKPLGKKILASPLLVLTALALISVAVFALLDRQGAAPEPRLVAAESRRPVLSIQKNAETSYSAGSSAQVAPEHGPEAAKAPIELESSSELGEAPSLSPSARLSATALRQRTLSDPQTADTRNDATRATDAAPAAADALTAEESAESSNATATGRSTEGVPQATGVHVQFMEIPFEALQELTQESHSVSGVGPKMTMGILPEFAKKTTSLQGTTQLDSAGPEKIRLNQPILIYKGMRDASGQDVGLTVQITPMSQDESGTDLQIELSRSVRYVAQPVLEEASISENVIIPRGAAAFIAGALPRRNLTSAEIELYRNASVLRVLTSDDYQSNQTEFVIFVAPK